MILVKPSFEILMINDSKNGPLHLIELAGRTCYKSESKLTKNSAEKFTRMVLKRGHESVIEHSAMTVKIICDRGVSHELVRHRLCAFSQESTRYCNYKDNITFIIPPWIDLKEDNYPIGLHPNDRTNNITRNIWADFCYQSEKTYINLISLGWTPQQARSVLPNSTKTEIVVTANFREWRHIFNLRCAKTAHPQMREIMIPLHEKCKELIPVIFEDISY